MNSRIGILGGTFDPPHFGHLLMAQEACSDLALDRVVFVPASHNPLKTGQPEPVASVTQRLAMLELALSADPRFAVSAIELERGGESYTIDTLHWFRSECKDAELFLLMGADTAGTLKAWRRIEEYSGLCTLAIANRPGSIGLATELTELLEELRLKYVFIQMPPTNISSTELRSRAADGLPLQYYMPDSVADYISSQGLYRAG